MTPVPTPFSELLTQLIAPRGAASTLAANSDLYPSQISRFASATSLPEPETFAKIAAALPHQDRNALTVAYLLTHKPSIVSDVAVIIRGQEGSLKDRLTAACDQLDPRTREDLATVIEGLNKAPEQAALWIRSMAGLLTWPSAGKNSDTSPSNKPLQNNSDDGSIGEAPGCSPISTSAESAISTGTAPAASSGQATAKIVQLPRSNWLATPEEQQAREAQAKAQAAEETAPPPVPKVTEEVKYTPPPRRRKK